MICAIDVGNSSMKGGLFEDGHLRETFKISLEEGDRAAVTALLEKLRTSGVQRLGVSSVVPSISESIDAAIGKASGVPIFHLTHRAHLPFELRYETPDTMGVDRIAAAAGAWAGFGGTDAQPIVVIDAGTAVTADVLSAGALLGGVIMPGPELQRRAVRSGTAQLPTVDLHWPRQAIARTTRDAVVAGIMFGFVDGLRGVLVRIINELDAQPHVVSTGGWGKLLSEKIEQIGLYDPDLVLRGVTVLMDLNP